MSNFLPCPVDHLCQFWINIGTFAVKISRSQAWQRKLQKTKEKTNGQTENIIRAQIVGIFCKGKKVKVSVFI